MLYNYIALAFFAAVSLAMPFTFLLGARLLGRREPRNAVKGAPYESGEETIGGSRDVDNEYLPLFMLFVPFELVAAMLLIWAGAAASAGYTIGIAMLVLGSLATALALLGYAVAGARNG